MGYLGLTMEVETLIDAVLTLPGERLTTPTTETVRIYRQPRDPKVMAAVQRACEQLGYSHEELSRLSVPDIDPGFPSEKFETFARELVPGETVSVSIGSLTSFQQCGGPQSVGPTLAHFVAEPGSSAGLTTIPYADDPGAVPENDSRLSVWNQITKHGSE